MNDQLYKCGYCGFVLNSQCENLLEHEWLQDIFVEGLHDLVENHKKVLTIIEKGTDKIVGTGTTAGECQSDTFEEELIKYVRDRPALYNFAFPIHERTSGKKSALWLEIFNLFGGKYSIEDLQKNWKYLRGCYIRAKKRITQYVPSGSGATAPNDPGFRHYKSMKFVYDRPSSLERSVCSIPKILTSPGPSQLLGPSQNPTPSSSRVYSHDITRRGLTDSFDKK